MTIPILDSIPSSLAAGTSARWKQSLRDYSPALWTLTYYFRGNGSGASFNVVAETVGSHFEAYLSAATTTGMPAGDYWWQAMVTDGTDTVLVDSGRLKLLAGLLAQASPYDGRSPARITLEAIDAQLQGRASKEQQSFTIGDRQVQFTPIPDLLKLRDYFARLVTAEQQAERLQQGGSYFKNINVRFTRPRTK